MVLQAQVQQYPVIYMDERERGEIRAAFAKMPCEIHIDTFPIGDYIISPEVGIERKRGDDLKASICDNRFFVQLVELKEKFTYPIVILEQFTRMFDSEFRRNSLYGALMYIAYKWNITVIPTENETETARVIWSMAKYYQQDLPKFTYQKSAMKEPTISVCDQVYFLEGFLQVGVDKAKVLLNHFGSPDQVIHAILNTVIKVSPSGKTKRLEGPFKGVKGFGPKFIESNQRLLSTPFDE